MTSTGKKTEKSKRESKKHFNNECLVCSSSQVDGCHIFSAGNRRYSYLKTCKFNIIPLCRFHHSQGRGMLDLLIDGSKRNAWGKIRFIRTYVMDEHRYKLEEWLIKLYKEFRNV